VPLRGLLIGDGWCDLKRSIASHRKHRSIASHRIASHRIASHRIASHGMA